MRLALYYLQLCDVKDMFLIALHKRQYDLFLMHLCSSCLFPSTNLGHVLAFLLSSKEQKHKLE